MSMPTIPKEPFRPNIKEVTIDLLESIALEEIALSHIMNAEAEKIQAFVGEDLDFPTNPKNKEIIKFNQGVNRLLETIVMKEWLLLNKLENVLDFFVDESHKCARNKDKHHSSDSSGSSSTGSLSSGNSSSGSSSSGSSSSGSSSSGSSSSGSSSPRGGKKGTGKSSTPKGKPHHKD